MVEKVKGSTFVSDIIYKNVAAPPKRQGQFHRPRVDMLLSNTAEHSLVITVMAGAGCGKTQAVLSFLENTNARAAWFQLSKLDNYQRRFYEGFINAVSWRNKDSADGLRKIGFPDSLAKFNRFLHIFANEIYNCERFFLVFDDFHLIYDETVINFVENLILAKLENFCIIINSRMELSLNLTGMTSNGLIGRVNGGDLRFTLGETVDYLKFQGLELAREMIERIYKFTDGWPMALYLTALSVKKNNILPDNPIAEIKPLIFNLIEKEIFSFYTQKIKNLLTKLSLLYNFPVKLIKELSDNDIESIKEIENTNMFILYDENSEQYYFHHLFLEFLNEKQIYLQKEEITEVYIRAAQWFLKNNHKLEAVMYYKECGYHEKVWEILLSIPPERRPKNTTAQFLSLMDGFPVEFIRENPMIRVIRAALLLNNMELETAERDLSDLLEELNGMPDTEENIALSGEVYIVLGLIKLTQKDFEFLNLFKSANECLPNGSSIDYSNVRIIDTNNAIITDSLEKKDLDKMLSALFEALPYISKVMNGLGYGAEYLASAEIAYYTGDLNKAEADAFQAIYRAGEKNQADIICGSYYLLMRIAFAKGKFKQAVDYMEKLRDTGYPGIIDIAEGWFYIRVGRKDKIARWLLNNILNDKVQPPISVGRDRLVRAHYLLEEGKYYELLALLEQLDVLYQQKGLWFGVVSARIFKTAALYYIGEDTKWPDVLKSVYDMTYTNNFVMIFAELGNHMRTVIGKARQMKNHNLPQSWLDEIYSKSSTYAKRQIFSKAEYERENKLSNTNVIGITEREKEILQNLYQGLTREEIAESLYISLSTVKSSLNNIYRKLDALNSVDAVRIALQMKII